jgi:YVTN family beta-propeller protein
VEGGDALVAIDAATSAVATTVSGISEPHNVQVSPGGDRVYAVSGDTAVVAELDAAAYRLMASGTTGVAKIDLRAAKVVARTAVSAAPAQAYFTPDGRTLLSADQGTEQQPGTTVSLIDTRTMVVTGRIVTGSGPHGLVVDPQGGRAWVTNVYDGTVSVLDLSARRTVATVEVGDEPNGISFTTRPPAAPAAARVQVTLPPAASRPPSTDMPHDHGMPTRHPSS